MGNWRKWVFGGWRSYAVPILFVVLLTTGAKELVQDAVWAEIQALWKAITGRELAMSMPGVITFLAIFIPVIAIFSIGAWWSKKRLPKVFFRRGDLERSRMPTMLDVSESDVCLLSGRNIFSKSSDALQHCRVLLPDPESESVARWTASLSGAEQLSVDIYAATETATKRGAEVKWYPFFVGTSWWIGNRHDGNGFFHFETVLPHLGRDHRPAYRVYKWQDEQAFKQMCNTFDKMWRDATIPREKPRR